MNLESDNNYEERNQLMTTGKKILLIDAVPTKGGDAVQLADYTLELLQDIEVDYSLADYGKGPGMLRDALKTYIASKPLPETLTVSKDTSLGRDLLEALIPYYDVVIRGIK